MSKKAKKVDKADLGKITAERGAKVYDAVQKRRRWSSRVTTAGR